MAANTGYNIFNSTDLNNSSPVPFSLYMWPAGAILLLIGIGGLFGNVMIMAALFVSSELKKNRCNILVGNLALCDFISTVYIIVSATACLATPIIGVRGITLPQDICFYTYIPTIISFDAGSLLVLSIGLDRAISLWYPIFYKNLSVKYALLINGTCWGFGVANAILGYFYKTHNEMVTLCMMPTAVRGAAFVFWNYSNIVINILVIITYAAAYYKAKQLSNVASSNNDHILRKNRLLTSLIICVCIYIIGWMVTMLVLFLVNILASSESVIFHCSLYAGILAALNVGCNFYVYYGRSDEYRQAFRKILGCKSASVSIVQSVV